MQLKYFGSKAWLAPHMDRLLGDVAVLHSPFFGSGKLEYYLAARRPGLEVRGVNAFEPVANLVSQMVYILPERLLALVRPAFDLVLRRIRSLKRCVQACGCKIETPRYAPQFGSRLHFKRCQALPKETPFPFFWGTPFFGTPCFLFFVFS